MDNQVNTFTSTGQKILRHPDLIDAWKKGEPIPYSLQIALTEHCNLNCEFCSVKKRNRSFEFSLEDAIKATERFINLGIMTTEITGGGEPLCFPHIRDYCNFLIEWKIKIGLITNGININGILNSHILENIDWIRISANVYDYTQKIDIPKDFNGTLGFSYVWTEEISSIETLLRIQEIALINDVEYIRLVPNCLSTIEEQHRKNDQLVIIAEKIGSPVFFQRKEFETPKNCYWGYLKPFLYPDGYVYPCSSLVLNSDADRQFHEDYRLCHWTEVDKIWTEGIINSLVDTRKCDHCVFAKQNEMLEYIKNVQEHEDFI